MAQHVSVGYQAQAWAYEAFDSPLHGFSLAADWPTGFGVYFDMGMSGWHAMGSPCYGFLEDPSDCPIERQRFSVNAFGMGARWAIGRWPVPGGEVAITPFAGYSTVNLSVEGPDGQRRGSDSVFQLEAGALVRYRTNPFLAGRIGLFTEVRASGGLAAPGGCEDCFDPLRGSSGRAVFLAGLSIGR